MKFGDILRELLEEYEISQKDAAQELNLAPSTLGNYVRNIREPDYETLKHIATFFNVSIDYLLDYQHSERESHDEEHLMQIFRNLDKRNQKLYLEQGALLLKYSIKPKKE